MAEAIESIRKGPVEAIRAKKDASLVVMARMAELGAEIVPDAKLTPEGLPVLADGKPTNGTANRDKILQAFNGHAMKAANVLAMTSSELRELYPKHQIFYVYHDRIDAAG